MFNFNEQQIEAINHYKGPCAVIASAGSGKSTVLVHRIKNLIENHNVNQSDILAISFTSNTAKDLKKKLNEMGYRDVIASTFHSLCLKIFSEYNIPITYNKLIQEWQMKKCFTNIDKKANDKDIMGFIGYQKSYMRMPSDVFMNKDSIYNEDELREFYKAYEDFKKKNKLYDMDDWLIECYKLLHNMPKYKGYEFVLGDEHQDDNFIKNLLLKELCRNNNMFAVGDYRQCLYSFNGSVPEMFMNFSDEWKDATIINLDTNYRSTKNIVDKSNCFIKKYYGNYEHYSDSISSNKSDGIIKTNTYIDRTEEGLKVIESIDNMLKNGKNPSEISILYRLNSQSGYLEYELKKRNIPYDITNDSSFFKRKEVSAIISYLRLINNPHDDEAFDTIFKVRNYPLVFFSNDVYSKIVSNSGENNLSTYESFISMRYEKEWIKKNMEIFKDNINRLQLQHKKKIGIDKLIDNIVKVFKIEDFLKDKYIDEDDFTDRMNSINVIKSFIRGNDLDKFLEFIDESATKKKKSNKDTNVIKLMTIHASKGLEFENVFLIGVEDGKFPHKKSSLVDEARLFYVGCTRSKDNLFLSQIGGSNLFIDEYENNVG